MPRHAALDVHSINAKVDQMKEQIEAELDELESRFEDLYNIMDKFKKDVKPKKTIKAKKKAKKLADEKI